MKILSCNAGYLLGYQNVLGGYVPPPLTSLVGNADEERRSLERLVALLDDERPDVVSLLEVDRGSHRTATDGQFEALLAALDDRGLSYDGAAPNKYGDDGVVASLPFFGHLGNAVLSRSDRRTAVHYLSAGRKRLVQEVALGPDAVLFQVHLSLGTGSRRRQFRELAGLVTERADGRDVVVTGDFNAFDGPGELDPLVERASLEVHAPGPTVPARPLDDLVGISRDIDLFLCSPSVRVSRCDVLDVQLSDHRPVILETAG